MSLSEEAITLQRAAHELMYLGMDGSPVYSDDLSRRNGEVYGLTMALYRSACYGEVFDEALADEGRSIIASWDSLSLTPEQQEAVDEFQNVTDNPYPWEYIDE